MRSKSLSMSFLSQASSLCKAVRFEPSSSPLLGHPLPIQRDERLQHVPDQNGVELPLLIPVWGFLSRWERVGASWSSFPGSSSVGVCSGTSRASGMIQRGQVVTAEQHQARWTKGHRCSLSPFCALAILMVDLYWAWMVASCPSGLMASCVISGSGSWPDVLGCGGSAIARWCSFRLLKCTVLTRAWGHPCCFTL